jgi:hypothetical protein
MLDRRAEVPALSRRGGRGVGRRQAHNVHVDGEGRDDLGRRRRRDWLFAGPTNEYLAGI